MHKKLLLCVCAAAAAMTFGCNEVVEWNKDLGAVCGNNIVESGEVCDGSTTQTCADFDSSKNWASGQPICNSNCQLAQGTCVEVGGGVSSTCGNGELEAGEACEGDKISDASLTCEKLMGTGATGTLKCNSECHIDASDCTVSTKCGNGELDEGELCDGDNFGDATCESMVEGATGGSLSCVKCDTIDTSNCELPPAEPECGNGILEDGEACDGEDLGDADVECAEGTALDVKVCKADCSGIDEEASCKAIPEGCGNGDQDGTEECDVDEEGNVYMFINEAFCEEGKQMTDPIVCNAFCEIDREASCEDIPSVDLCGNGILDEGEVCDLDKFVVGFEAPDCEEGMAIAVLTCNDDCTDVDIEASCLEIPEGCGDLAETEGEECEFDEDGNVVLFTDDYCDENQNKKDEVVCNAFCKIDRRLSCEDIDVPAPECGNGILEDGEVCDGEAFADDANVECAEGMALDVMTCKADCSGIDEEASCKAIPEGCGNGEQNDEEECDVDAEGNVQMFINEAICDENQRMTDPIVCNAFCKIDRAASCEDIVVEPVCGNGIREDGEFCDGDEFADDANVECAEGMALDVMTCKADCSGIDEEASCKAIPEGCGNGDQDDEEECDVDGDGNVQMFINEAICDENQIVKDPIVCNAFCKIDRVASCEDIIPEPVCGNGILEDGELCDGEEFAPYAFNCEDGKHLVAPVCADDCMSYEADPYCEDDDEPIEIPETCSNDILYDGDEICDASLALYTPAACLYDNSVFDDDHVNTDHLNFWIPSEDLVCSAACGFNAADVCVKHAAADLTVVEYDEFMTARQTEFRQLAGFGVKLSDGMSSEYVDDQVNSFKATKFGPWMAAGADNGTFNAAEFVRVTLTTRRNGDNQNWGPSILDSDLVSIFFKYRRDNANSPKRYAVALYDGDELVRLIANFGIDGFNGWGYTGELVFSIKDLADPNIRIHNYDIPNDTAKGSLFIKDFSVKGISIPNP